MTKKRRDPGNQTYRPRKKSQGSGNVLSMRASKKKEFKDEKGVVQPVKHSVAINAHLIANFSPNRRARVVKKFEEIVSKIPTHAPSYTPKKNAPSTPTKVKPTLVVDYSPSAKRVLEDGTEVRRIAKVGEKGISIYTNEPPPKKVFKGKLFDSKDKDVITDKDKIELLKDIPPPPGPEKRIEAILNKKSVDNALKKSSRDQKKFFNKISPNKLAEALQESYELHYELEISNGKIEISHLEAYRFEGEKCQKIENLVLQSDVKNTWMIPNEDFTHWLINEFPNDDVKLISATQLKPKIINNVKQYTHFADGSIIYQLTTSSGLDTNLNLTIVDDGTPYHIQFAKYMEIFKVQIINQKEILDALKPPTTPTLKP